MKNVTTNAVFIASLGNLFSSDKWQYCSSSEVANEISHLSYNLYQAKKPIMISTNIRQSIITN